MARERLELRDFQLPSLILNARFLASWFIEFVEEKIIKIKKKLTRKDLVAHFLRDSNPCSLKYQNHLLKLTTNFDK